MYHPVEGVVVALIRPALITEDAIEFVLSLSH